MHIEHSDFNDQLVRGLTHRMNNILTLFHGYLALLLDDKKLDPSLHDGLARIKEGASAASELMDRTKALARPSSVIWREVNLFEFLHLLKQTCEEFVKNEVTLDIVCPETLPTVWADPMRLRAVVTEIVRNACEASPRGGVVRIEGRCETPDAPAPTSSAQPMTWVSITVTDQGNGISEKIEAKIFQPFFTTKQKENATGLGLTVALGLIQQLGGVIRVDPAPGRTAFRILLPSRSEKV